VSGAASIRLPDPGATARLGAALAPLCEAGDVIALRGALGAGKTTLVRGLVTTLCPGIKEVTSPTYTLVQTYPALQQQLQNDSGQIRAYINIFVGEENIQSLNKDETAVRSGISTSTD